LIIEKNKHESKTRLTKICATFVAPCATQNNDWLNKTDNSNDVTGPDRHQEPHQATKAQLAREQNQVTAPLDRLPGQPIIIIQ